MIAINVALEVLSIIISSLLLLHCFLEKGNRDKVTSMQVNMLIVNILILMSECFAWIYDGRKEYTLLLYIVNSMIYIMGYLFIVLFAYYITYYISQKKPIPIWIPRCMTFLCGVAMLLVFISLFNHMFFFIEDGTYTVGPLYGLSQVYPCLLLFVSMFIIIRYHTTLGKRDTLILLAYGFLPVVALVLYLFIPGINLLYVATTLSLLILHLFVHLQQTKQMKEQAMELDELNVAIALSQIQPHFLFSSLDVIQSLCAERPMEAKRDLGEFAKFLRMNMDSLTCQTPIPFETELEHVNHFLDLEQLRYKDKLHIVYDIREQDFSLPALSIQTIIENSVKYGIGEKEEGITICLKVVKEDQWIVIEISDDGIGFDVNSLENSKSEEDNELHVGLKNVKERVGRMMGGEVSIESRIGYGTVVTIRLRES